MKISFRNSTMRNKFLEAHEVCYKVFEKLHEDNEGKWNFKGFVGSLEIELKYHHNNGWTMISENWTYNMGAKEFDVVDENTFDKEMVVLKLML